MNNEKICEIFKPDNSLSKYRKMQEKRQIQVAGAIIAKNQQIARKELKRHLNFLEQRNLLLKKMITNQKILNLHLTFYELHPIILIQSHIRRWICQKSYEIVIFM